MQADQKTVLRLLKTARGQLDGIIKMVEEDRYCLDVSNQLMATQSILKKANRMVLKAHMNSCVRQADAVSQAARHALVTSRGSVAQKRTDASAPVGTAMAAKKENSVT